MDIRNLLQFQGAFHGDGIIDSSSYKENIFCGYITVGKPLNPVFIIQKEFYLIRKTGQITQHLAEFRLRYRMLYPCKFHSKQIESNELRAVGFGSGNRDFRPRPGIHHII